MVDSATAPKTQMAAVVFLEIADFSGRADHDQLAAKATLANSLKKLLEPLPADSYVVHDAPDGVGVAFLNDPEHALYFALRCGFDLDAAAADSPLQRKDLRLGISLDTVQQISDAIGGGTVAGEGLNAAQRTMRAAAPGDITASRNFFGAVSRLHMSYGDIFEPRGNAHAMYRLNLSGTALLAACDSLQGAAPGSTPMDKWSDTAAWANVDSDATLGGATLAPPANTRSAAPLAASATRTRPRTKIFAGVGLIAVVAVGVVVWNLRSAQEAAVNPPPAEHAANRPLPPTPATPEAARPDAPTPPTQEIAVESKSQPGGTPSPSSVPPAPPPSIAPLPNSLPGASPPNLTTATPPKPAPPPMVTTAKPPAKPTARPAPDAPARYTPPAETAAPVVAKSAEPAAPRRTNSARCSQLLQRAQIGDAMTPQEQSELANACR